MELYSWHLGKARIGPAHTDVWLVRGLSQSVTEVFHVLHQPSLPDQGLVVTTSHTLPDVVCPPRSYRIAALREVIVNDQPSPGIDIDRLQRILAASADEMLQPHREEEVDVDDDTYAADIERIRAAFTTDSTIQKEKLRSALRETPFVMVVDAGDGKGYVAKPGDIYIATDRLKQLFAGVPDVLMVDDEYGCLRGENMRELLEACGAVRYPRPVEAPNALARDEKLELRRQTGHEETSGINDRITDWLLQGFDDLIALLPKLNPEQRAERARLIWESLGDLEERRGRGIFDGSYTWSHYGERKTPPFPAAFMRRLNKAAWVPDANGELVPPRLVVFDTLGWKPNPFLLTKIAFKPPIIDQLAKEAGIDPAALDLLRKYGITSVTELASRLGITSPPPEAESEPDVEPEATGESDDDVYDDAKDLYGDDMPDIPSGTLIRKAATARQVVQGVVVAGALAPAHTAAPVATLTTAAKDPDTGAAVKVNGRQAMPEGDPSFPTSELIRMTTSLIRTGSIRRHGCKSRSRPSHSSRQSNRCCAARRTVTLVSTSTRPTVAANTSDGSK